jgi:starvation-inducible DNA-binding protein
MTTRTPPASLNTERIESDLRPLLTDLLALALQGKQMHWNVEGPLFSSIHAQLDTIVEDARAWSDEVAERMVALGVYASGQPSVVAQETTLPELPQGRIADTQAISLMMDRVASIASTARSSAEDLESADVGSQDVCLAILRGMEKHHWMLRAQRQ